MTKKIKSNTSIVTPAYNAAGTIGECIESVLAQTCDDWTMIIVDDGSKDQTADIVREYAQNDPRIQLIQQANQGASAARNTGVAAATSELISFLDADDAYEPGYLDAILRAFDDEDVGLATCDLIYCEEIGTSKGLYSERYTMTGPITIERVLSDKFTFPNSISMRKHWFDKVGGFSSDYRITQDYDLWTRFLLAGGNAQHVNQPLSWYRIDQPNSLSHASSSVALRLEVITIVERMATERPELKDLCDAKISQLRHLIAVEKAKVALLQKDYATFFDHADQALNLRPNRKLWTTRAVARLSPWIAHKALNRLSAGG